MIRTTSLGQRLRTRPWQLVLLHALPVHRVIWVTQGQGRVLLATRRRGVSPHNMIFVPAGQPFAVDHGPQMTGHILEAPRGDDVDWPGDPRLLKVRDVGAQGELTSLFDAMNREQSARRPHMEEAMGALLRLVSVWVRRHLDPADTATEEGNASDRLIAAFLDDLERLYATGAPMADFAERLDVSATHLSRVCKAQLGRSAADLITERVLYAARERLCTTPEPVQDIAAGLGFGSAAYFSRFVQTHVGDSPRALRQRAQQTGQV